MGLDFTELLDVATLQQDFSIDLVERLYSQLDEIVEQDLAEATQQDLIRLFLVAQHVMKSKDDQLSVTMEELEHRAEMAGETEELRLENTRLQALLSRGKTKEIDAAALVELQESNDALKKEVRTRQKQLDEEKKETDKLLMRVEELESERRELRRQVEQLKENIEDIRSTYENKSSDAEEGAGLHSYTELLRQKNQHISTLLDDVEAAEKENGNLREMTESLQSKLSEATSQMNIITAEFQLIKSQQLQQPTPDPDASDALVEDLRAQLSDACALKSRRDAQFDQLTAVVEQRSDELRQLIQQRDAEIDRLTQQLKDRSSQEHQGGGAAGGDESVRQLRRRLQEATAAVDRQRLQITELESQLRRAAAEMDASAQLLEQTQAARSSTSVSASYREALLPLRTELTRAESQIAQLQDGQHKLEALAAEKDQEIASLTRRLAEMMEGEFGLSEAVAEIRQCQKQLQIREQQLSEQNGHVNLVQGHLSALLEENTALRKRLGMGPHEAVRLTGQDSGREQLVHVLEREVEKLEEERIALKLENRKLSSQIRTGTMTGLTPDEIRQVCKQRKQFWISVKQQTRVGESTTAAKPLQLPGSDLFERCAQLQTELNSAGEQLQLSERTAAQLLAENDRLRAGMREILDSIKQQDASSAVKLSAPSLETLLSALDTRRLVGEYHPSLVPYSTLQQLEGRNEELRHQLKLARSELAAVRGVHSLPAAPSNGNITSTSAAATSFSDILHTPTAPPAAATDLQLAVLAAVTAVTDAVTAVGADDDNDGVAEDELEMDGQLVSSRLAQQLTEVCASGYAGPSLESQIDRLNAWYCTQRRRQRHIRQQHEQTAVRWQQAADQLESTEAEVETLRAQLSQADLYRTTVLTSGEELRHGVARLHRQMALRVSQLVRVERQLRCTHAQCERLEQELAACQQRLDRTKCRAAGNMRQLTAENKSLQLQLAACRRQLASTEAGGRKPDTDGVESYDADKLTNLQNQLMAEESASSRLQAELMQMRKVILDGEGVVFELEDSSVGDVNLLERQRQRAEHAEKMSGLLREQLDASEGRCQQLQRQIGELAVPAADVKQRLLQLLDQLTDDVKATDGGDADDDAGDVVQRLLTAERDRDAAQDTAQLLTDQLRRLRADQTDAAAVRLLYEQLTAEIANTNDARSSVVSLQLQLLESQRVQRQQLQRLQLAESELQVTETRLCRSEETSGQLRVRLSQLQAAHARQRGRIRTAVCQLRSCLTASSRPARCLLLEHVAELLVLRQQLVGLVRDEREALASVQEERDALQLKQRVFDETLATLTGADESAAAADSLRVSWVQKYQTAALLATEQRLRADRCRSECSRLRTQLADEESRVTAAETALCRLQNQLEEDSSAGQQLRERLMSVDNLQLTVESPAPISQHQLMREEEAMSVTAASTPTPHSTRRSVVASTPPPAVRASAAGGGGDCSSDVPPAGWSSAVQGWLSVHGSRLSDAICWLQQRSHQSPSVSIDMTTSSSRLQTLISGAASPFDIVADLLHVYADVTGVLMQQQTVAVAPATVAPSITISDQQMAPLLRRVRLAEDAAQALRQRLQQKEQLVDQLKRQPDQSRDLLNQLSDQLEQSEAKRRQQSTLVSTLQSELAGYVDRQHPVAAAGDSQEQTARRLQRLGESEQLLAEQERAIGALMERLRQSRASESRLKENVLRLEADLLALSPSSGACQQQPGHDVDGGHVATEARGAERIPAERESNGTVTSQRVKDRVLQVFTDWEKKHPRHKRLLDGIRTEVVRLVNESCVHVEDVAAATATASNTVSSGAAVVTEMEKLRQQLNSTQNQLNLVQSELNERTLRCHRLQSDVYEAERRRRDEAQTAQRRLQELKDRLAAAEQQLQLTSCRRQHDKQKIDDEVSRWDERKRLQKQALRLRAQLDEKLSSCEQLQSAADSLRETVRRLKRDKRLLETKLRSQPQTESAVEPTMTAAPAAAVTDDVTAAGEQLVARDKLKQQVQSLAQKLARERTTARQLQLQLDSVSERDSQLTKMNQQLSRLRSENQQLEQQLQLLREERDSAVAAAAALRDRQLDSCPAPPLGSTVPAASSSTTDLSPTGERGTISILRRLVERLRAENLRLRHRLMQFNIEVESHSQLELVRSELSRTVDERDRLSVSLQRLHESSPRQRQNTVGN